MELIIKPTEACNFACTFCSSNQITQESKGKAAFLKLETIYQFLERFPQTHTIIVNGGDPLMMSPDYYWSLIDYLETRHLPATLSLTTNLWDFYLHPDKWTDLFCVPRVGITTSFHYGDTRRINSRRVYDEGMFWKVSDAFFDRVGYRPDFISVINEQNEYWALDNVRLAKKMQVECKLNNALASGREGRPYQLSKIYQIYPSSYRARACPLGIQFQSAGRFPKRVAPPPVPASAIVVKRFVACNRREIIIPAVPLPTTLTTP